MLCLRHQHCKCRSGGVESWRMVRRCRWSDGVGCYDLIGFPTCVQLLTQRKWNVFPRFRDRTLNKRSRRRKKERQKIPCWNFTVAGVRVAVRRNIAHGSHSVSRYCNSRVRAIATACARVLCSSLESWILRLSHRFSSCMWATESSGHKSTQTLNLLPFLMSVRER